MDGNLRGEAIKRWREEAGLSQEKLVEQLSYDRTMVSYWETGKSAVSNDLLLRIAKATGREINDVEEVILSELRRQAEPLYGSCSQNVTEPICEGDGVVLNLTDPWVERDPEVEVLAAERRRWMVRLAEEASSCAEAIGMTVAREVIGECGKPLVYLTLDVDVPASIAGLDDSVRGRLLKDAFPAYMRAVLSRDLDMAGGYRLDVDVLLPAELDEEEFYMAKSLAEKREVEGAALLVEHGYYLGDEGDQPPLAAMFGRDWSDRRKMVDLRSDPLWLIVREGGFGRTCAVDSILLSLMTHMSPQELRITWLDLTGVAAQPYKGSPYCPVDPIRDKGDACGFLAFMAWEVRRRLAEYEADGVADIDDYNETARTSGGAKHPYWVVAVDAYSLISPAADEVDELVGQLAQGARDAGVAVLFTDGMPDLLADRFLGAVPGRVVFSDTQEEQSLRLLGNGAESALASFGTQNAVMCAGPGRPFEKTIFPRVFADGVYGAVEAVSAAYDRVPLLESEGEYAYVDAEGQPRIDYKAVVTSDALARSAGMNAAPCRWADGVIPTGVQGDAHVELA